MTDENQRVRCLVGLGLLTGLTLLTGCASGSAPAVVASPTSTTTPAVVAPATNTTTPAVTRAADGVVAITSADVPMPASVDPEVSAAAPQRIVSLATGVGETLAALGVADRVVGRDETSDVPAIDAAPVVTRAHAVNAEQVLALDPDLVLIDDATSPPEAIDQIRGAGIDVVTVPAAWTISDIAERTRAVATAVGASLDAAEAVIAEATGADTPTTAAPNAPRVAFLYLRGSSAIYLVGGSGSGADALIAAAGGIDVGAEAGLAAFVPLSAEALAAMNPDIVLVMTDGLASVGGVAGLVQLPGVAQTTAGARRNVVAVDDTLLLSFGPRTHELVTALAAAFAASSVDLG